MIETNETKNGFVAIDAAEDATVECEDPVIPEVTGTSADMDSAPFTEESAGVELPDAQSLNKTEEEAQPDEAGDDVEIPDQYPEEDEDPEDEGVEEKEEAAATEGEPKEEKKDEPKEEVMPEFTGTTVERALQKLDWEFAHAGKKDSSKPASVYDQLLENAQPQNEDKVLCYLKDEVQKDEAFAERVLLPYKSFKRCMKVFVDVFTRYFNSYGLANCPTAQIGGRDCKVGVCTDEMGFSVIKGYYNLDDEEQVKKDEAEEKEKAKKAAAAAAKKTKAKNPEAKKPAPAPKIVKKEEPVQVPLFDF